MRIGCPKEIKTREYRVGLTPTAAREAVAHGHGVLVERGAGEGSGYADADYLAVGAEIVAEAPEVWARSELVVKVKEPQAAERAMLRAGQVLFAYLHLAPDPEQTRDLLASGATAIAGFAALIASDIRMLRDFGIVTVVDLTVSLLGVLLVLPAALIWAEQRGPARVRDL
ncbi:MAG TPA: hypothetical protein VM422_09320, partial [Amaricoccus sp.]|nr:hypothetical protein [Amaricoccus sp.]